MKFDTNRVELFFDAYKRLSEKKQQLKYCGDPELIEYLKIETDYMRTLFDAICDCTMTDIFPPKERTMLTIWVSLHGEKELSRWKVIKKADRWVCFRQ